MSKKRSIPGLFFCFTLFVWLGSSILFARDNTGGITQQPIALTGGTIIDGTGCEPIPNGIFMITGDKIGAVGKEGEVALPAGCRIIDVQGGTILPGLINAHVHEAYHEKHAALWASYGVTTVRDLSCGRNEVAKAVAFRNRARSNPALCRIISAGSMITVPWGYMSHYGITVRSENEAQLKVTQELDAGVDFVKITLQEPSFFLFTNLKPKLAKVIVAQAHSRGVPVTTHVGTAKDLKTALDAGVDDVAHIVSDYLPAELIDRMINGGVFLEPTLTNWATSRGKERALILSNLQRYVAAGGQVALGAEHIPTAKHAGPFVGMPVAEFLMMREAGMTPLQIVTASTLNAARACKISATLGSLEPGKIADILVVNGNPLLDLRQFADAKVVIHNGVVIRQ